MIAWVGVITALFAATIAMAQTDIKKVLAYSTVSQLGYMFLAVGVGGYWVAIFHMITHAFFKALLFLGAGSVIHGMDDEQDMRRMGALRKSMPITAGDLHRRLAGHRRRARRSRASGRRTRSSPTPCTRTSPCTLVGLFTALLTAFYMSRQVFLVFYGGERWNDPIEPSTHEAHSDAEAVAEGAEAAADAASRRGRRGRGRRGRAPRGRTPTSRRGP